MQYSFNYTKLLIPQDNNTRSWKKWFSEQLTASDIQFAFDQLGIYALAAAFLSLYSDDKETYLKIPLNAVSTSATVGALLQWYRLLSTDSENKEEIKELRITTGYRTVVAAIIVMAVFFNKDADLKVLDPVVVHLLELITPIDVVYFGRIILNNQNKAESETDKMMEAIGSRVNPEQSDNPFQLKLPRLISINPMHKSSWNAWMSIFVSVAILGALYFKLDKDIGGPVFLSKNAQNDAALTNGLLIIALNTINQLAQKFCFQSPAVNAWKGTSIRDSTSNKGFDLENLLEFIETENDQNERRSDLYSPLHL